MPKIVEKLPENVIFGAYCSSHFYPKNYFEKHMYVTKLKSNSALYTKNYIL